MRLVAAAQGRFARQCPKVEKRPKG